MALTLSAISKPPSMIRLPPIVQAKLLLEGAPEAGRAARQESQLTGALHPAPSLRVPYDLDGQEEKKRKKKKQPKPPTGASRQHQNSRKPGERANDGSPGYEWRRCQGRSTLLPRGSAVAFYGPTFLAGFFSPLSPQWKTDRTVDSDTMLLLMLICSSKLSC